MFTYMPNHRSEGIHTVIDRVGKVYPTFKACVKAVTSSAPLPETIDPRVKTVSLESRVLSLESRVLSLCTHSLLPLPCSTLATNVLMIVSLCCKIVMMSFKALQPL
jgi:hypothetical protein